MKKMVVGLWAAGVAICQQPKFELADVHTSPTSRSAAQNSGGVLRGYKYVNRDVTMLGLIEGGWNFFIGWTPRAMLQPVDLSNQPAGTAADPTTIAFFEAVERELGLKLAKQTRRYPVIVVDHIEEKPVE